MDKDYEKFSIRIETDEGLEEVLSFLHSQNVKFAPSDEKRIVQRLRLYARRLGLKNYSELLACLKSDKKSHEQLFHWLESGRTYNSENQSYSPLIKRNKGTKKLSSHSNTEKKKKPIVLSPKSLIPPLMIADSPKDIKNLPLILNFLTKNNINYQAYKQNYFFRRLHTRMNKAKAETYADYLNLLQTDSKELIPLLASFSINVTRFFRDKELFTILEKEVFINLLQDRKTPIRIWSAGCAIGPEPYSLAILIRTMQEKKTIRQPYLLATDINKKFLQEAKEGKYSSDYLKEVDKLRIQKFFKLIGPGEFQLVPEIRQMVTLQQHDLRTAPPGNNFDLILCRNVLIYFSKAQSDEFFKRFLSVLNPNGYLVLGKCEILPQSIKENFFVIDTKNRIYRRKSSM
jgi:chemotaxis protein methyltransferase CheR